MSSMTARIEALDDLSVAELASRYEQLHGQPPRVKNKAYLRRRVAWKLQEQEFGGLSPRARSRLDALLATVDLPLQLEDTRPSRRARPAPARAPLVGTTLIRKWRGEEYRVEALDDGFAWQGTTYRSLSAVARAITGSNWNGRLFFGLTKRGGTSGS